MHIENTYLPDVKLIKPRVFADERGLFYESYNENIFANQGIDEKFIQDNHSLSKKNVIRGLHYQIQNPQGKLVRVVKGEVFDVAVDLRQSSPTFKQWLGVILSETNQHMLWVPPGFAHGFLALSDEAIFLYKTTDYWAPQYERTIIWNDPSINIIWPLSSDPILSEKDAQGVLLSDAEVYP